MFRINGILRMQEQFEGYVQDERSGFLLYIGCVINRTREYESSNSTG